MGAVELRTARAAKPMSSFSAVVVEFARAVKKSDDSMYPENKPNCAIEVN